MKGLSETIIPAGVMGVNSSKDNQHAAHRHRHGFHLDRLPCKADDPNWKWLKGTHSLAFHAREDDAEHLRERGFSCGLIDEVAAGQVDVVAGPDCQEHRALMDLNVRRGHDGQQGLHRSKSSSRPVPETERAPFHSPFFELCRPLWRCFSGRSQGQGETQGSQAPRLTA